MRSPPRSTGKMIASNTIQRNLLKLFTIREMKVLSIKKDLTEKYNPRTPSQKERIAEAAITLEKQAFERYPQMDKTYSTYIIDETNKLEMDFTLQRVKKVLFPQDSKGELVTEKPNKETKTYRWSMAAEQAESDRGLQILMFTPTLATAPGVEVPPPSIGKSPTR